MSVSIEEPVPGWLGNSFGPAYLFIGTGVGAIHVIHYTYEPMDLVPVDLSINSVIVACYDLSQKWFVQILSHW